MRAQTVKTDDTRGDQPQADVRPPLRHGANLAASRAMARRLKWLIRGNPEPDPCTWDKLGQALMRGDPLADELVAWMHTQGMGRAWPMLERAIAQGLGGVADAPVALWAFMQGVRAVPDWLDTAKLAQGAQVLQATGLHGMMVLRDAGLMAGYQASAINQTLIMTGALHRGAQRRVAETTAWWLACTADGGMRLDGAGFQATLRVRVMHAMVRHQLSQSPQWDAASLGLPINQLDMQATYLAFSVVQLLALRTTGVLVSRVQSEAVMHLWRYIGWVMGVDDALLCDDEQQGRILLYRNLISQAPADESSQMLGRALMDEPLARHYPNAAWWRGRLNKARHLSLVRWFVGTAGMRNLGLPASWPWYPLLMMVPLAVRSGLLHLLPFAAPAWRKWARDRQVRYLAVMMGDHPVAHGGAAPPGQKRAG